jgi:hypothetical protein
MKLSYDRFSEIIPRVNTTLANAYDLSCERDVSPLYINDIAYMNIKEVLTANGTYEIPDKNWEPKYVVTKICPTTIIRIWYQIYNEPETINNELVIINRRLNIPRKLSGLTSQKENEITYNIRYNVVPLLQTGQYDIEIWLNGKRTLIETVRVNNLGLYDNSNMISQHTNTQNISSGSLIGGLLGALAFVAMFILIGILVRRHMKKKNSINEIYIENPMMPNEISPLKVTNSMSISPKLHKALTGFKAKSDTVNYNNKNFRQSIAARLPAYEPMNVRLTNNYLQPSQAKIINNQAPTQVMNQTMNQGISVVEINKDMKDTFENDPQKTRYLKVEFRPVRTNSKGVREINIDIDNKSESIVRNNNENIIQTNVYKEREVFAARPIRPPKKFNKTESNEFNEYVNTVDNMQIRNPINSVSQNNNQYSNLSVYQSTNKRIGPVRGTLKSVKREILEVNKIKN